MTGHVTHSEVFGHIFHPDLGTLDVLLQGEGGGGGGGGEVGQLTDNEHPTLGSVSLETIFHTCRERERKRERGCSIEKERRERERERERGCSIEKERRERERERGCSIEKERFIRRVRETDGVEEVKSVFLWRVSCHHTVAEGNIQFELQIYFLMNYL